MRCVDSPQRPMPLEYADLSNDVGEPLRGRLVLGMLSLIGSVAAVALVWMGMAMYRSGAAGLERHVGAMSALTSLAVGVLALGVAIAARSRARETRALARLALASNLAYWAIGAGLLCWR